MAGIGVAALGLVLSLWLAQHQAASMAQIEEARFTQETRAFSDALSQRIAGHTEVVNGLRGLFTANPRLSRLDFERAASEMEVGQRYPGVRNLSFTRWVPGPEREAYEARVRADTSLSPEGLPEFKIHPPGERPEYFVAEYLWPMFGNEGVLGLDISAQPTNLAAMRYSRDSGQTVVSAPFDLLQESSHRAGIVIRVPVFDPTAGTAEQRFVGAVASTLRVYDLVQGLGSQGYLNGIAVAMDDLGPVRANSGDNAVRPLLEQTAPGLPGARPLVRVLAVHDRRWQLTFYPTRSFLTPSETRLPWLAGLAAALKIWDGGLGIWGAVTLGALGAWIGARRAGVLVPPIADAIAPAIAVAQAIGRWGNWFNSELFGAPTSLPWGLEIAPQYRPVGYEQYETFHPTFLYESLWLVGLALVLVWADRRFRLGHGRVFALYVLLYCVGRGWIEALRIDNANHILGLRLNDWTALLVGLGALAYLVVSARRRPGRETVLTRPGHDEPAVVPDPADEAPRT